MKPFVLGIAFAAISNAALAQDAVPQTLFTNVHVFDGVNEARIENANVLVTGNLIETVSTESIDAPAATVIDGDGRTLTPGFIDNHVHLALPGPTIPLMETDKTWMDLAIHAVAQAEMYLMQGFTTVRDAGGADAGIRRAIDQGIVDGPRVYISAAFIGGRGGHADFAAFTAPPDAQSNMNRLNIGQDADGVDAVLKVARNNFRMGANQLKVMQSGGVVSSFDPWQMEGRTVQEIEAAVEIAEQYGSYAMAHSYRKDSILRALDAGVKSIEHGFMYDCEIGAKMDDMGAFITTNLTAFDPGLTTIPAIASNPSSLAKALSASAAFTDYIDNMRSCPAKRGHHTDCVGTVEACNIQIAYEKHLANEFFGPYTSLVALTSVGGEIAALTGDFMNPYPDGKLGVIQEGAYADILLIDGNPLEDFSLIGTGDKWFDADPRPDSPETIRIIMKDGVIYKNTL